MKRMGRIVLAGREDVIKKDEEKARRVLHGKAAGKIIKDPSSRETTFRSVEFMRGKRKIQARFYKDRGKKNWQLDYMVS